MNKDFEKEVINCSRCGLCMDVCPVYKVKQTETSLLRGKFLQILGIIRGDLKYDNKIAYNLDLCLSCKKCQKACPSDIDAIKIFSLTRAKYKNLFEYLFYSAPVFKFKMFLIKILYKLKYSFKQRKIDFPFTKENIGYFRGCLTRQMGTGLNIKSKKFNCCGIPFYIKGKIDLYEKYKKRNMELIKKYDKVIFDCATCFDTVLNYEGIDKSKLLYFTDFYKNQKLVSKTPCKVTFHKPCHLDDEKFTEIENILKNIKNVEYIKLENYDDCCGFGGDFFTRHIKTAYALSYKKNENVAKTNADIVLTTCPTCLWSLKFGIKTKKSKIKALDLAEFFGNCDII